MSTQRSRARSAVSPGSATSQTDDGEGLPTFSELKAWTTRLPQNIVKCSVRDVCTMPSVRYAAERSTGKSDLFMLHNYPCHWVELVGWVAGIDAPNEKGYAKLWLDDGDGSNVIQVDIHVLELNRREDSRIKEPTTSSIDHTLDYFPDARRKTNRVHEPRTPSPDRGSRIKLFQPLRVLVGDTVRLIGCVNEYTLKGGEGVRGVQCDLRQAGSITKVNLATQLQHAKTVAKLHRDLYRAPFAISSTKSNTSTKPASPSQYNNSLYSDVSSITSSLGTSDMFDSQAPADIPKLRAPERLHRRLLTDETYLRYLQDYMTTTTISALDEAGPSSHHLLGRWIPEFTEAARAISDEQSSQPLAEVSNTLDPLATPTPSRFRKATFQSTASADVPPFSISHLARVPELLTLAELVVNADADRRVKQKIKSDPVLSAKTSSASAQRRTLRAEAQLAPADVSKRSRKLLMWALRRMAEEGSIVQVHLDIRPSILKYTRAHGNDDSQDGPSTEAYLPLPPHLIAPILIHLLDQEQSYRKSFFMKPSDPRRSNGMAIAELLKRLRSWGDEGRWERLPEWVVEDGIEDLARAGKVQRWGSGWWPAGSVLS